MIESEVTDLPDPDSPTTARVWPRLRSNVTPSTALAVTFLVLNQVRRSRTERMVSGARSVIAPTRNGDSYPAPRRGWADSDAP